MFSAFIVLFMTLCSLAYAETAFVWPVEGPVITEFNYTAYQSGGHRGIDIAASEGVPVKAAADGRIYWIGAGFQGPGVGIEHVDGKRTTYMPVAKLVKGKQEVKQGDVIGTVLTGGSSASQSHLHFGVKVKPYEEEDFLNPGSFLIPLGELGEAQEINSYSYTAEIAPPAENPSLNSTVIPPPISVPTSISQQVAPTLNQTALIPEAQDVKGIVVQPDQEPIAPKETVSGLKESTSGQSAALAKNLSPSPGSSPHIDTRVGEILSPPVPSPSTSSKGVEPTTAPNSRFTNDRQSGTQPGITTDFSDAEVATNPWQIALLSIACLLTLSFTFKKRIAGFLASRAGFLALRIYPAPALGENGQW